jgi:hypothetical protein
VLAAKAANARLLLADGTSLGVTKQMPYSKVAGIMLNALQAGQAARMPPAELQDQEQQQLGGSLANNLGRGGSGV